MNHRIDLGELSTADTTEGEASSAILGLLSALHVSGRYTYKWDKAPSEELALDVDGRYPQMAASGTLRFGLLQPTHWVARLTLTSANHYTGSIWFKDGPTAMAYTQVDIVAHPALLSAQRSATVTFSGGGAAPRTRVFRFASRYFHPVEFE